MLCTVEDARQRGKEAKHADLFRILRETSSSERHLLALAVIHNMQWQIRLVPKIRRF